MAGIDADKIKEIDSRLRSVEDAILEISLVAKYAKYGLIVLGLSLGIDLTEMVWYLWLLEMRQTIFLNPQPTVK